MSIELSSFDIAVSGNYSGTYYYDANGLHLNGQLWMSDATNPYIEINPDDYIFKYDIVASAAVGNWFLVGWERYDANKTSRPNAATIYVINHSETAIELVKQRYKGTINLTTDGVNPCKYIKLRILNYWKNNIESTKEAVIHSISLLAIPKNAADKKRITRTGIYESEFFKEGFNNKVSNNKYGYVEGSYLYEI